MAAAVRGALTGRVLRFVEPASEAANVGFGLGAPQFRAGFPRRRAVAKQHAALSGGPHTNELIDRLFRPMFAPRVEIEGETISLFENTGLQPWAVMAFNNLVMSYVTMAPMYRDLLGEDPFSEAALEKQLHLIKTLLRAVFDYKGT